MVIGRAIIVGALISSVAFPQGNLAGQFQQTVRIAANQQQITLTTPAGALATPLDVFLEPVRLQRSQGNAASIVEMSPVRIRGKTLSFSLRELAADGREKSAQTFHVEIGGCKSFHCVYKALHQKVSPFFTRDNGQRAKAALASPWRVLSVLWLKSFSPPAEAFDGAGGGPLTLLVAGTIMVGLITLMTAAERPEPGTKRKVWLFLCGASLVLAGIGLGYWNYKLQNPSFPDNRDDSTFIESTDTREGPENPVEVAELKALETEMDEATNAGDVSRFLKALEAYQRLTEEN